MPLEIRIPTRWDLPLLWALLIAGTAIDIGLVIVIARAAFGGR